MTREFKAAVAAALLTVVGVVALGDLAMLEAEERAGPFAAE